MQTDALTRLTTISRAAGRSWLSRGAICGVAALVAGSLVSPAMAVDELLLKNDNIPAADPDFPATAPVGLQFNFDANEKVGVVLLIPPEWRPAKVLRVQVMWRSATGNTGSTIQDNLEIWKGRVGTTPVYTPTASKIFDSLDAPPDGFSPQLVDGFVNEYDLSEFDIIIPAEYDRFTFAMTFAQNTSAPLGATTPIDLNGILPQRNYVFGTIPPIINTPQWFDMANFQQTGDVIMRAVITRAPVVPTRCGPADIANDQGEPIINPPSPPNPATPNNGVTEGDYNAFFSGFFDAQAWCDIADDQGTPLAPFGTGGTGGVPNNGVTEGDYNLFFSVFFDGC